MRHLLRDFPAHTLRRRDRLPRPLGVRETNGTQGLPAADDIFLPSAEGGESVRPTGG